MLKELTVITGVKETERLVNGSSEITVDYKKKTFTAVSCLKNEGLDTIQDMLSIYLWNRSEDETIMEKELADRFEHKMLEKYGASLPVLKLHVQSHKVVVSMAIALGGHLPKGIDVGHEIRTCRERVLDGDYSTVSDTLNSVFGLSTVEKDDNLYIKRVFKVTQEKARAWFDGRLKEHHKAVTVKVKGCDPSSAISDKSITLNHFYTELMLLACSEMGMPLKHGKAVAVLPTTADRSIFK